MTDRLFVYGTLLPTQALPHVRQLTARLKPLSPGSMPGRLYDLGDYPAAVYNAHAATRVFGEVLQLPTDSDFLKELDEYEGYNPDSPAASLFTRETRTVALRDGTTVPCWVYLYNRDPANAPLISSGDYSQWRSDNRK